MKRTFIAAAVALLAVAGPMRAQGAARRTVRIAAAANLKVAVEALEAAFEAARPDVDVAVTLGASGLFVAQIQNGAPFDLFLSADREYPRKLIAAHLAAGDDVVYAIGALVVWTPRGSPIDLERRGLAALAGPEVKKLAIANPAVAPFGRAAESALRSAGLLDAVRDRLVFGQSVAQAAQFAATGAADAALIPRSLTFSPELGEGRAFPIPAFFGGLPQSAVVLAGAREPALARAFLGFLTGPEGRAILAKYGYALP
jgi:molybdate transport system substrate-binding protein